MKSAAASGRTILFVSHNISAVKTLCSRGILLQNGWIHADGSIGEIIAKYNLDQNIGMSSNWLRSPQEEPAGDVYFTSAQLYQTERQAGKCLVLEVTIQCESPTPARHMIAVDILSSDGVPLMQGLPNTEYINLRSGVNRLEISISLPQLIPGQYTLDLWTSTYYTTSKDYIRNALTFDVNESPIAGRIYPHPTDHGYIIAQANVKTIDTDKA